MAIRSLFFRPALAIGLLVATAILAPAASAQLLPSAVSPAPAAPAPDTVRFKSGVRYWTTHPGTGERPKKGQKVWIHYTGRLADGKIFDTSQITGKPLKFTLGAGQVIVGMDEMVALMHVGEKVTVRIPAVFGYGPVGQPDDPDDLATAYRIPPNADLTFDLELLKCSK